jgi:hypothetical protein
MNLKRPIAIAIASFVIAALGGTVGYLVGRMLPSDAPLAKVNLSGEHSASIAVTRSNGSMATGEPWSLRFLSDRNAAGIGVTYGDPPRTRTIEPTGVSMDVTLSSGTVPESGIIELQGLPGGESTQMLHLTVGDSGYLGISLPDEDKKHEAFSLQLPVNLQAGSQAPQMDVVRISDGKTTTLPTPGKISYLEFWGVHCGPCQKPLSELNDVVRRHSAHWGSTVHFASVCLDPIDDVKRHVAQRNLTSVEHFVPTGDHPAAGTPNPFGVLGVPRAFLIDATGRIVWAGHPAGFDVEKEVASLLEE